MYNNNNSASSIAFVSSMLFPHHHEDSLIKRRRMNLSTLPGAWIDQDNSNSSSRTSNEEEDLIDNDISNATTTTTTTTTTTIFIKTVSDTPPKLPSIIPIVTTSAPTHEQDVQVLKQTIENLRKEQQKLEETNNIVKKSIQIVAEKRLIAHKRKQSNGTGNDKCAMENEDFYIIVPLASDDSSVVGPTQDEMKAAGLDGWEWITVY